MADPWSGIVLDAGADIYGGRTAAQQAELDKVSKIFGGGQQASTLAPEQGAPPSAETSPLWYALIALVVIGGGYALFKD